MGDIGSNIAGCAIEGVLHESERATIYRGTWNGLDVAIKVRTEIRARDHYHDVQPHPGQAQSALPPVRFQTFDSAGRRITVLDRIDGHPLIDELAERTAIHLVRIHEIINQMLATGHLHPSLTIDQPFMKDGRYPVLFGFDAPLPTRVEELVVGPYTAPEQLERPAVTNATNIYATGAILYTLLAGVPPFASPAEAIDKQGIPPSIHPRRPGLADTLVELIHRCLHLDPGQRPGREMRSDPGLSSLWFGKYVSGAVTPGRKRGFVTIDPQESTLIDALRVEPSDQATRQVYADWLEAHGFDRRAQNIRVEDFEVPAATEDAPWRAITSQVPIGRCTGRERAVSFSFECPRRWDALEPTPFDDVRLCKACEKPVYFVTSPDEARAHGSRNECVAIDCSSMEGEVLHAYDAAAHPEPADDVVMGVVAPAPELVMPTYNPPPPRGWDELKEPPAPTVNPPAPRGWQDEPKKPGWLARLFKRKRDD